MNYARAGRKRMAMHDFHKKSWPFHSTGRLHNFLSAPANLQWKVKGVRAIANIHSHDFIFMGHLSLSRLCEWNCALVALVRWMKIDFALPRAFLRQHRVQRRTDGQPGPSVRAREKWAGLFLKHHHFMLHGTDVAPVLLGNLPLDSYMRGSRA